MAQVGNNDNRFGGEYMIQDRDHMSEISEVPENTQRAGVRQSEQSQSGGRQQGSGEQHAGGQQGSEQRHRPSR